MLSAGIAVFFYLRVVLTMFASTDRAADDALEGLPGESGATTALLTRVGSAQGTEQAVKISPWMLTGLVLVLGATVVLGIWPEPLISFAHQASLLF
jgi:NADH:ubiquinone oxidoreductase subunit 2 (subunit N)